MAQTSERLYTVAEAARARGCTRYSVYRAIRYGRLKAHHARRLDLKSPLLIRPVDLVAWLESSYPQ